MVCVGGGGDLRVLASAVSVPLLIHGGREFDGGKPGDPGSRYPFNVRFLPSTKSVITGIESESGGFVGSNGIPSGISVVLTGTKFGTEFGRF